MEYWFRRAHLRNTGDVSGHPVFFSAAGMVMRWSNVIYSLSPPVQISEWMTRTSVNHVHHIQLFKVFTYLQFKHDATQSMCSDFYRRKKKRIDKVRTTPVLRTHEDKEQGSHFFGLTKFHDISMIFPGFFSKFPGIFPLFLKYDFQVVLNINMQTN